MIGKPKFKLGETVYFKIDNETYQGDIYIIDEYGTFEDDTDVSYDIMVHNWGEKHEDCLFKHVNEKLIITPLNIDFN